MRRTTLLMTLVIGISFSVFSQDSLRTELLRDVIVTGQYEPQSAEKSVYQVRVIPVERIQSKAATNLQDLLNTELTIRFSQDPAMGTSNISMLGLDGTYVKVLIDGVPIVGKQGTQNDININQININMIERVELVEGPMSVAYGSDALAGVINIITKKAYDQKLGVTARVHEETVGKEYGSSEGIHNQQVGVSYSHKKLYGQLDVSRNYFGGWKGNSTGRETDWNPKTQYAGNAVIGYKAENFNIYYRIDALNETIKNPGNFDEIAALDQKYITNRFMHQVQGDMQLSSRLHFNGAAAFTDYSRKTQSIVVNKASGKETLALGPGLQDVTTFTGLTVRGTFQYKVSEKLTFQPGYDMNTETGSGGRLKEGTQEIQDYAVFASAEYKPIDAVSIRPGVRVIHNSKYEAPPFVSSLNTKFKLSPRSDLRISYGRGFRAPVLRELYFNFFDASHSIEGNPNLEAELSHSMNASYTWDAIVSDKMKNKVALSGFYNRIDNQITTGFKPGNGTITTYINVEQFRSQGVVLTNTFRSGGFEGKAGFSYTGRYNRMTETESDLPKYLWTPEVNTSLSYTFKQQELTLNVYYKYTGELPAYETATVNNELVSHLFKLNGYHWADLSVQKKLFKYLCLTGGVRNLFNVIRVSSSTLNAGGAHDGGASAPVGAGTSYFLSTIFTLTK